MKCKTCRKEYGVDCDYRQGRCLLHPLMPFPNWLLFVFALVIIPVWCIMHPRRVWEQAKQDWREKYGQR